MTGWQIIALGGTVGLVCMLLGYWVGHLDGWTEGWRTGWLAGTGWRTKARR